MKKTYWITVFLLIAVAVAGLFYGCGLDAGLHWSTSVSDNVSYNFHIRPILSDNCFTCHGPDANQRKAGLRLDIADEAYKALKENPDFHAIVPGKPRESMAYMRITSTDPKQVMPPPESNLKLEAAQIALIEKWIRQGAAYEKHWAFVKPEKVALPQTGSDWPKNEIDHFILAAQERAGLAPAPEAPKENLLRRLSFDLRGIPPALKEINAFLSENDDGAYGRWVDKFLADPAFGERMAATWMEVARYADSHGYQDDYYRTQWPWRDWVIHAFNNNMPYDQFITRQLAGDLMAGTNKEMLLATAFNRNHKITEESGAIDEEYRVMYVVDRTNTFGKALMGITMECANCHDHKYDPISQKEYFRLYAFFNNISESGMEEVSPGFSRKSPAKYPLMEITDDDVRGILHFVKKPDSAVLAKALLGYIEKGRNREMLISETSKLKVSVMGELQVPRKTHLLERGAYDAPGEEVTPGTPESILGFSSQYPANRLGLAQWLFDPEHPLTARVYVNRLWQDIFGKGIVPTSGDFGMQGQLPSHPELLDWLAVEFREGGWNIKGLLKKIVTSATYMQSSGVNPERLKIDPENKWLSGFPRLRLSAMQIRDMVLVSSGLLVDSLGGPSVKPYQPPGIWEAATSGRGNLTKYEQDTAASLYRKGLYTFIKRTAPPPMMMIFDASTRDECVVENIRTNTPLQALVMMNDPTVLEASKALSAKLLEEGGSPEEKIQKAFQRIVGRKPDDVEASVLLGYLHEQGRYFKSDPALADKLLGVGWKRIAYNGDSVEWATMMQVVQAIYNLDETTTKS